MTAVTRRDLLAAGLGGAGALLLEPPLPAIGARRRRPRLAPDGAFTHGVASGLPGPRQVVLWTRLDGHDRTMPVRLEVAADPDFRRVVHREVVDAVRWRDFTARARVPARRLRPDRQYWYRFETRTSESPVGRFKTALPADSREPVRIGFFSCQNYARGFYTPHAALAAEPDLDLVICLGDYIYERTGETFRPDRTGANGDSEVQTLPEYRDKYRLYRTDLDLQAMHAAHPFVAVWDDHEFENNYNGAQPSASNANTDVRRVSYEERRRQAFLAFFEYMPVYRMRGELDRIYRRIGLGANADLFLLDTRQYRDPSPCDGVTVEPCPRSETDAPRTLLGPAQKEWLKAGLAASTATWKVLGQQVMMMSLDGVPGTTLNVDQWDGYAAERHELMRHVLDRRVGDVTVLTGDIHTFFAGTVTTTGRSDGMPAATEFVGGSVTSNGIADRLGGDEAVVVTERVTTTNPHMAYTEQRRKGYGVLEARRDELLVEYKAVESVEMRPSPAFTLQRFRVARGSTAVELL